jgi:streptomycin 6-kinase
LAGWDGDGAAQVFAHDGDAVLMERAVGERSLGRMARCGQDDEATRILCAVAARLHASRPGPSPQLVPLSQWFAALWPAAATHGGLLADPRDTCVLRGDIHHANVLDFGARLARHRSKRLARRAWLRFLQHFHQPRS